MLEKRVRVLLADDHELFAAGIRRLLEPRYSVGRIVTDGSLLVEAAQQDRPDLILCDISMPGLDGIDATRTLRKMVPEAAVIVLTMHEDAAFCKAAFEAGAKGYVVKSSAPRELLDAVDQVLSGRIYATPSIAGQVMRSMGRPADDEPIPLTTRESEVAELVAQGLETSEIAGRLRIAEVTVRSHYSRILRKLGLRNRIELTRYVLKSTG